MDKTIAVHSEVLEMLSSYRWPGNVRELENVIERAVTLNTSGMLSPADFSEEFGRLPKGGAIFQRELVPLDEIERQYILYVLQRLNGNMSRTAEVLQIDRRTLYRMVERFGARPSA